MPVLPFDMATTQRGRTREVALVKRCVVSETVPRIHTTEQFDAILAHNPRKSPGFVFRDELVAELGRFSGLRRMEIAALSIPQLDSAVSKGSFFTLQITCTKGSRPRTIFLHSDTMNRLRRYIEIYRPTKVQAGGTGRAYPTEIFLTQNGRPLRREYITATWKLASKAAGSTSTFHWTRADFVTAVVSEADSAGLNSMRIAQDLAGHASESTTARYVRTCVAETTHPWANDLISEMYHGNKNK